MLRNREKKVFLATTALEAFWDVSQPIVFLGPWCKLHARRAVWRELDGQLMQDPFARPGTVEEAYRQVHACHERVLPVLAAALNRLHGTDHGVRYWRIVAGPWLHAYLAASFERYLSLKMALSLYPKLDTIVLANAAYVTPTDTHDFASYLIEDTFNLQMYSRILDALGLRFREQGAKLRQTAHYVKAARPSWKQTAARFASRRYAGLAARVRRTMILKDSYFPKPALAALAAQQPGKILPLLGSSGEVDDAPLRPDMRAQLHGLALGDAEFERCIAALLPADLPKCFVENYAGIGAVAQNNFPRRVGAIFSANAWYYDEVFKRWAAAASEQGTALLGCQHGGNYGSLALMPSEDHETAIVDRYFSWGWERAGRPAQVVPMPAPKLIGQARVEPASSSRGLLWVATTMPRYLVQFPWTPGDFERYLEWQQRFAAHLAPQVFEDLRLRPHREDNGWGLAERIRDAFPQLAIESWNIAFQESLANCALYICDHLSTTFIEALVANRPTVLFWETSANVLRPEAEAGYGQLREAGILFDSPEAAADAVNVIRTDIGGWWQAPARQRAVAAFCARFARTDGNALAVWQAEFDRSIDARTAAEPGRQ